MKSLPIVHRTRARCFIIMCIVAAMLVGTMAAEAAVGDRQKGDIAPRCATGITRVPHKDFQETGKLLVLPPSEELTLEPGTHTERCIGIDNRTSATLHVTLDTVDVEPSDRAESVLEVVDSYKYGTSSWITLAQRELDVAPGEDVLISYTIDVPANASVGGNYGGIEVKGAPTKGDSIGVVPSLVSQVLVTVPGALTRGGSVVNVRTPKLIKHGSTSTFRFEYQNRGNVTDHVSGTVRITSSISGKTVATLRYQEGRVLRDGARGFVTNWSSPPWIGRFSGTLIVKTDDGTKQLKLDPIWVVPPTLYVVLLLALIAASIVLWQWNQWRNRRWLAAYENDEGGEYLDDDSLI